MLLEVLLAYVVTRSLMGVILLVKGSYESLKERFSAKGEEFKVEHRALIVILATTLGGVIYTPIVVAAYHYPVLVAIVLLVDLPYFFKAIQKYGR
jgi:hypothetical protein